MLSLRYRFYITYLLTSVKAVFATVTRTVNDWDRPTHQLPAMGLAGMRGSGLVLFKDSIARRSAVYDRESIQVGPRGSLILQCPATHQVLAIPLDRFPATGTTRIRSDTRSVVI